MNRYDKDAEKIYKGLQTLIQEKIHDLPEVSYIPKQILDQFFFPILNKIYQNYYIISTLPIDTLFLTAIILKFVFFHEFPIKSAWDGRTANSQPKELQE